MPLNIEDVALIIPTIPNRPISVINIFLISEEVENISSVSDKYIKTLVKTTPPIQTIINGKKHKITSISNSIFFILILVTPASNGE